MRALIFTLLLVPLLCHGEVAEATPAPSLFEKQASQQFERHGFKANDEFNQALSSSYEVLVASELKRGHPHLSHQRLSGLFQDAYAAFFYSNDGRYLHDMSVMHDTLSLRSVVTEKQTKKLFDAYLVQRDFTQASRLQTQHEHLAKHSVPIPNEAKVMDGLSLFLPQQKNIWEKQPVDLRQVRLIVTTNPLCHFSKDAFAAISQDASMRAWFAKHAVLLMDQRAVTFAHENVLDWNKAHPELMMHHVVSEIDWPMVDVWSTPTFYFIRHGKEVERINGWRANQEPMGVLKSAIKRIDAMHD